MDIPFSPHGNTLINALPLEDQRQLIESLEPLCIQLGEVLYESEQLLKYVFFPVDAIVSLLYVMENGASTEIAVVVEEGMVGTPVIMSSNTSSCPPWCRAPGMATASAPAS